MTDRTHFMSKKRSGIAGFDKENEERKKLHPLLKLSLQEHSITSTKCKCYTMVTTSGS